MIMILCLDLKGVVCIYVGIWKGIRRIHVGERGVVVGYGGILHWVGREGCGLSVFIWFTVHMVNTDMLRFNFHSARDYLTFSYIN